MTNKILIDRAVVEQVLEALIEANVIAERYQNAEKRELSITALRSALEQPGYVTLAKLAKPPNDAREALANTRSSIRSTSEYSEQAEQEPCIECGRPTMSAESKCDDCHSMDDAAPVRTKDLTDAEIMKINVDTASIVPTCDRHFHFARAVIAADREKNK